MCHFRRKRLHRRQRRPRRKLKSEEVARAFRKLRLLKAEKDNVAREEKADEEMKAEEVKGVKVKTAKEPKVTIATDQKRAADDLRDEDASKAQEGTQDQANQRIAPGTSTQLKALQKRSSLIGLEAKVTAYDSARGRYRLLLVPLHRH